jgi:hypothetical protein
MKDYTAIIYGAGVVLMAVFMPMGIVGKIFQIREHRTMGISKPTGRAPASGGRAPAPAGK